MKNKLIINELRFFLLSHGELELINKIKGAIARDWEVFVLLIIPFLRRIFFNNWGKKGQISFKKRYYSDYYKTSNKYQKDILDKISKMCYKDKKISEDQHDLLRDFINDNFRHVKFGEYEVLKDGSVIFEAYDLTRQNNGKVYFNFDKEKDKYIYVFKNEENVKSYVNEITIKSTFSSVKEFNKNIKKMSSDGVFKRLNIDEKGQKIIGEKLQNIQNVNISEELRKSFLLNDLKMKKGESLHFKDFDEDKTID